MLIGELADTVGVNPKTIRYYESIGLLPEPARTSAGYRNYEVRDVERLAFVRRATKLNLQLDEIAEILALRDRGERPCDLVLDVARGRIHDLDAQIDEMHRARDELKRLLTQAPSTDGDGHFCQLIEHRLSDADRPS